MQIFDRLFVLFYYFIVTCSLISCQRIINNSYKRTVFFTGTIVREDHLIDFEVADESPRPSSRIPKDLAAELHQNWFPNYVFLVPPSQAENVASWDANIVMNPGSSSTNPLSISDITSEVSTCQK